MVDINDAKVYILRFPNGKIYIGSTTQKSVEDRWMKGCGYWENKQMYSDIVLYGWNNINKEVVLSGVNILEAHKLEEKLISEYNSIDPNIGYNRTKLAIGCHQHSKETLEKMSKNRKGKGLLSDEQKRINRDRLMEYAKLHPGFNIPKWSDERKLEQSKRMIGNKYNDGRTDLQSDENRNKHRKIMNDRYKNNPEYLESMRNHLRNITSSDKFKKECSIRMRNFARKINQYDIYWNFIREWDSCLHAADELNLNNRSISAACNNPNIVYANCHWKFITDHSPYSNKFRNADKVYKLNEKNDIIAEYPSISDAALQNDMISSHMMYYLKNNHIRKSQYQYVKERDIIVSIIPESEFYEKFGNIDKSIKEDDSFIEYYMELCAKNIIK